MEDKEKKGSYKKKGSAKESNAQEASNDVNDMEGGMKNAGDVAGVPKKKGAAAKTGGDKEMTAKELKAEGKKLKQQARDKKKADRKSARATKKSDRKTNKSKKLQDKIDLQTLKGNQKLESGKSAKAKRDRVEKLKTKKEKLDGAAKKKGSADYSFDKGSHDHPHDGAGRMGFTQNFGAARQNSYAQGAAKVASIMSFGASKKKGAADHKPGHPKPKSGEIQRDDSGKIPTTALNEVVLKPKTNVAYQSYKGNDYTKPKPDITVTAPGDTTPQQVSGGYEKQDYVRQFSKGSPLGNHNMSYNSNNMKNFSSGSPSSQKARAGMITDFTNFMAKPTSSSRAVSSYLEKAKAGPQGELISDISFYGGGKKKKHTKKKY